MRSFLELGLSPVGIRYFDDTHVTEMGFTLQYGFRIADPLQIVVETDVTFGPVKTDDEITDEDHVSLVVGLRWSPLRSRPVRVGGITVGRTFDVAALAIQAGLGLDLRERTTYEVGASHVDDSFGPIAAVTTSWLPSQGRDFAYGIELHGSVSRFGDGLETDLAMFVVAQLRN